MRTDLRAEARNAGALHRQRSSYALKGVGPVLVSVHSREFMAIDFQSTFSMLGQVGLAYVLTAIIGWDREKATHSAGLRTFPLVGMASCGYILVLGPHADVAAQSRVLQGLITGIGFVGGGAILKDGVTVRGTATAASIWNAGVIGASVAMGRYEIAVLLALLNLFTLRALLPIKQKLDGSEDRSQD
jgi:putative Mg2+ transporter-C (MgtC) family protein